VRYQLAEAAFENNVFLTSLQPDLAYRFTSESLGAWLWHSRVCRTGPCRFNAPFRLVQRDGDDIRITQWDFVPSAVTGWHSHGWAHSVVVLMDATVRNHNATDVSEAKSSHASRQ
jgi:hypothetical protein